MHLGLGGACIRHKQKTFVAKSVDTQYIHLYIFISMPMCPIYILTEPVVGGAAPLLLSDGQQAVHKWHIHCQLSYSVRALNAKWILYIVLLLMQKNIVDTDICTKYALSPSVAPLPREVWSMWREATPECERAEDWRIQKRKTHISNRKHWKAFVICPKPKIFRYGTLGNICLLHMNALRYWNPLEKCLAIRLVSGAYTKSDPQQQQQASTTAPAE